MRRKVICFSVSSKFNLVLYNANSNLDIGISSTSALNTDDYSMDGLQLELIKERETTQAEEYSRNLLGISDPQAY